ncbi:MAG: HNH endonuclease [Nitrospirae bacterium]|nr:HNH endonuclease [Nitrospirota bacterium]
MKFELEQYNRDVPDELLLDDLQLVARKLNKKTLTMEEYVKLGRFHCNTLSRRFGSWIKALEKAGLSTKRKNTAVSKADIISDLKFTARKLNKSSLTCNEYIDNGKHRPAAVQSKFGSWNNGLKAAGLSPVKISYFTNEELFHNLEEVWIRLGRQPKYGEIQKPLSKHSSGTYEHRFGTWRKALRAFVEYINDEEQVQLKDDQDIESHTYLKKEELNIYKHKTQRNISDRLKVHVLIKDGNKCKLCGITVTGKDIHFDHIKPWSKGGETVLENLQVLCAEHNLAKGNLDVSE